MIIEKLRIEEIPDVFKLYNELIPSKHDVNILHKKYLEIVNNDNYAVLVAKEGKDIMGIAMGICCTTLSYPDKNFLVIEDVIVSMKFRGRGIGKKLLESLDSFALEMNCVYAILISSDFREGAHEFYKKLGYTDGVKGFRKVY